MNNIENGILPTEQPPEQLKTEKSLIPENSDSKSLTSSNLEIEKEEAKIRDNAKISKIRASLKLENTNTKKDIQQHLQEYLELKKRVVERITLLKAKNLPKNYQTQREALHDERLDDVNIAIVPDDLWVKGNQPSESNAEKQLILIKQSYFEAQKNPDKIAWICHELAHCQNFLNSKSPEEYQGNMQKFAFKDLKTEYTYPNNPVEKFTFTKQFQYLKEQGKSKEDVLTMLSKNYRKEDFPFFNRLLDSVYKK